MDTLIRKPGWPFWFLWVIGTLFAYVLGAILYYVVGTVAAALLIGAVQWLLLRRYRKHMVGWFILTVVAVFLVGYLSRLIFLSPLTWADGPPNQVDSVRDAAFMGLVIGLCQVIVLWRKVRYAVLWVLTQAGARAISNALTWSLLPEITLWLLVPCIEATVMVWLLRQTPYHPAAPASNFSGDSRPTS